MSEYWFSSSIGRRPSMEDMHVAAEDPESKWTLYAVCDGHGGKGVVNELQSVLAPTILQSLSRASKANGGAPLTPGYLRQFLKRVVLALDGHLNEVIKGSARGSGSTLVLLVYQPQTRQIAVANVGDSRAVLRLNSTSVGGGWIETKDHKPTDREEMQRVAAAGSYIVRKRVAGILAMTRALGDFTLKRCKIGGSKTYDPVLGPVSALPDVQVGIVGTDEEGTAVLACDGLWDVMDAPEAVRIARASLEQPKHPAQALVDEAYKRGSSDNITVLVVLIHPQPAVAPLAVGLKIAGGVAADVLPQQQIKTGERETKRSDTKRLDNKKPTTKRADSTRSNTTRPDTKKPLRRILSSRSSTAPRSTARTSHRRHTR